MSKIERELLDATGYKRAEGESDAAYRYALSVKVSKLSDAKWTELSNGARDWADEVVRRIRAAKDDGKDPKSKPEIIDYPDFPSDAPAAAAEVADGKAGEQHPEDGKPAGKGKGSKSGKTATAAKPEKPAKGAKSGTGGGKVATPGKKAAVAPKNGNGKAVKAKDTPPKQSAKQSALKRGEESATRRVQEIVAQRGYGAVTSQEVHAQVVQEGYKVSLGYVRMRISNDRVRDQFLKDQGYFSGGKEPKGL